MIYIYIYLQPFGLKDKHEHLLSTLAKRAVSKAFSSVGSVARLLVPHMSLDAAAGSERASLIWSNNPRTGFRNELFHCEFVLVVGEFTNN